MSAAAELEAWLEVNFGPACSRADLDRRAMPYAFDPGVQAAATLPPAELLALVAHRMGTLERLPRWTAAVTLVRSYAAVKAALERPKDTQ